MEARGSRARFLWRKRRPAGAVEIGWTRRRKRRKAETVNGAGDIAETAADRRRTAMVAGLRLVLHLALPNRRIARAALAVRLAAEVARQSPAVKSN